MFLHHIIKNYKLNFPLLTKKEKNEADPLIVRNLITKLMFAMENPQKSFGNLRFNNAKKYTCFKSSYQNKRQTEKYVY